MKRLSGWGWLVLVLVVSMVVLPLSGHSAAVAAARSATTKADLASEVQAVVGDKLLKKAEVGVCIARLGQPGQEGQIIFQRNSTMPLKPASNLKVVTTSAAMDLLGADFQFRTMLVFNNGDLHLWGDGDPSLGDYETLKKVGWDITTVFKAWAQQLKQRNINAIHNLIVDDSIFDQEFYHPHWTEHQGQHFAPEIGGINLNINCLDFYVKVGAAGSLVGYRTDPPTKYVTVQNACKSGNRNSIGFERTGPTSVILKGESEANSGVPVALTIHDPSLFTATVLAETLAANGIQLTGTIVRDRTSRAQYAATEAELAAARKKDPPQQVPTSPWQVVGIFQTPLKSVMARANKESQNLYAEAMCKRTGAAASGTPGSWQNGTAAVGAFLQKIGVPANEFHLDDGCGLSRENGISTNAMVMVLMHNFASKDFPTYLETLSIGGVDGTLERRFNTADLRGRVFGKSGFIEGVSGISGYLHSKSGTWYAFSILMNGIPRLSNSEIKPLQERIIRALDAQAN